MNITVKTLLLGLVLATFSTGATAQQARPRAPSMFGAPQLEQWAERCTNARGQHTAEATIQACTAIIRSDQATSPVRAFAYYQRGAVRLAQADRTRALADFTSAVNHDPHFAPAYIGRAALYETQGEFDRAIADYDQIVRLSPDSAGAYNARCWLRARSGGDLAGARSDCDRAIQLGGGVNAYDSRGFLNLRDRRFEEAWRDYDAAVGADPQSTHSRYGRGIAALRLQRTGEGQADLAAALAADPGVAALYEGYGVTH